MDNVEHVNKLPQPITLNWSSRVRKPVQRLILEGFMEAEKLHIYLVTLLTKSMFPSSIIYVIALIIIFNLKL